MKRNEIYLGYCLELMPKYVEDKSIDMIFCDLPYGTTQCKWDSVINLDELWKEYNRIIKDNGAIVLFSAQPFTTKLINSNIKNFKYCWYWKKEKGTGFATSGKRPLNIIEDICVFYKKQPNYCKKGNPLKKPYKHTLPVSKSKSGGKDNLKNLDEHGNRIYKYYTHETKTQFLEFSRDNGNKGVHPTQKPLALIEYMIKTYTNEGDLILDNTCGSGTTGLGAKNLNRNYIMMEQDSKYYEIACKRVQG